MNSNEREKKITDGLDLIEEVFIDVLTEARKKDESWAPSEWWVSTADIASQAQLPRGAGNRDATDAAEYILRLMQKEGRVEETGNYTKWMLAG